ncbi:MAG: hypothetical protein ACFFBM_13310 [Promethearchaeota archaeon]
MQLGIGSDALKVVVKVGGSVMNYPYELREILKAISIYSERHSMLVVPGGGAFANTVRYYHTRKFLSDSAAHWLAIKCMGLTGAILADMQSILSICSGVDALERWADGQSFIIQPYELLKFHDRLPHSWDVTSDSIAYWIGIEGDADVVIFLKSVNPFAKWFTVVQSETEPVKPKSFEYLVEKAIIDPYMVYLQSKFQGYFYVMNGLWPENLAAILDVPEQ